jgi:hypothetical protein
MQLKDFKFETKLNKARLLISKGVYLTKRNNGEHEILLFHLGSFYAEMFFHVEQTDVGYIRCFESTDLLQPYLDRIDVSDLLDNNVTACYS